MQTKLPWHPKHRNRTTEQLLTGRQDPAFPQRRQAVAPAGLPGVFHLEASYIRSLTTHSLSNSSPPIYFTITDSLPLKLVYLLAGVTDDGDSEPRQMAFVWLQRQEHSKRRCCIFIDLHIPNNLMPVTFDNIMWRGQLDGANETVSKMDLFSTTLPLQIAVSGAFHCQARHLRTFFFPPFFNS